MNKQKIISISLITLLLISAVGLTVFYITKDYMLREVNLVAKDDTTLGVPAPGFEDVEEMIVNDTANWQTYRNEEFGFEFRYPREWVVLEDGYSFDTVDILEVCKCKKEDADSYDFNHSSEFTHFGVYPQGGESGGPLGEYKIVDTRITLEPENRIEEYFLVNDNVWGYHISFENPPQSWWYEDVLGRRYNSGFVWTSVAIEGMELHNNQLKDPSHDPFSVPISGIIDSYDLETITQILSTFKFIE